MCVVLGSMFLVWGCNLDTGDSYTPDQAVVDAFKAKYPDAKDVTWSSVDSYQKAVFLQALVWNKGWFENTGKWLMTDADLPLRAMPAGVQDGFAASEYGTWTIYGSLVRERSDLPTLYVLYVRKAAESARLYFDVNGVLLKAGNTSLVDIPATVPVALSTIIALRYPNALIVDITRSANNNYLVDIYDGGVMRVVTFSSDLQWISIE